jgi:hypothetical protein
MSQLPKDGAVGWGYFWVEVRQLARLDPAVKLYCCRHTFATDVLERTGNGLWSAPMLVPNLSPDVFPYS